MKRAIVTGGAGFIGSHVVEATANKGYQAVVVDDYSSGKGENLAHLPESANLRTERIDICDPGILEIFQDTKPEIVFHLAAQIDVRKSVADPIFDGNKNVIGTINVVQAAIASGAKHVVFASTGGAIYGEQETFPASEEHATRPEAPYGVSKRAAEVYLEYFARKHDISITSLRFSNVYGPRQDPHGEAGVVAIFAQRLYAGEGLTVFGDGKQTRDFVYVGDVANACVTAAIDSPQQGFSVFNIGTGVERNVLDLIDVVRDVQKEDSLQAIEVAFAPAREGEQSRSVIDPSLFSKTTGWKPSVSFDDGIAETIRSFAP